MTTRPAAVACFVGLLSAVDFAQPHEEKLVTVETLPPEPTVILSGDPVTITYRVRFAELTGAGKEIVILEDRMAPENLAVQPFEATGLQIEKRSVRDGHVWDLAYSLRLIHPDKSSYTIPPISIYWLVRDFGEAIEKAAVQQIETASAPIRYVSTITEAGTLDIRDSIHLGNYATLAAAWTAIAWLVSPLPLLLWVLYVGRLSRRARPVRVKDEEQSQDDGRLPDRPSLGSSRRRLRRTIARLRDAAALRDGSTNALERDLVISTRDYLHAELPELNPGDTAREISRYVETRVPPGTRQEALRALAARLVVYQRRLEQGVPEPIADPAEEARALDDSVNRLRPHIRMWRGLTRGR